ncbi:MAG: MBL fold metallo-hydrolase [Desulfitobacteriaceae bacterium]|nr:MBL fold metallo-hydrolase [Desulfitobacteriaceae bacterium]MDD4346539.1 MBL fold metallo-hydrolase [Desulfitobacteriaceae bacterium]MDD4401192.1 MBL fold metallo-hydrolase [Desulfitobacteriaceae bacterium]
MNNTFKVSSLELPTPFSVGTVNVYLLEAEPLTLIDTGVQTPEAESVLNKGLSDLGYSLKDIKRIFITHSHYDHSGLAGRISAVYGADVYIHPMEVSNMKGWVNLVRRKAAVCLAGGIPREIFNEIINTVQMGESLVKSPEDYIPLIGGELLPFDGFDLGACCKSSFTES